MKLVNYKNKLDRISENLKCPISKRIIDEPVITPSGIIYDKDKITMWLISSNIDSVSRKTFPRAINN